MDLVPQGTLPRSEFKARRVVDDRDLYRQALAEEGGADRDDAPSTRPASAPARFTPARAAGSSLNEPARRSDGWGCG